MVIMTSSLLSQVYSSTEHLATPSNLSFSSDRSHSEEKEERADPPGSARSSLSPADGERRPAAHLARWVDVVAGLRRHVTSGPS